MCAIMEELRNESCAEGELRGIIKILSEAVKEGRYTMQEAAAKAGMPEEAFIEAAQRSGNDS